MALLPPALVDEAALEDEVELAHVERLSAPGEARALEVRLGGLKLLVDRAQHRLPPALIDLGLQAVHEETPRRANEVERVVRAGLTLKPDRLQGPGLLALLDLLLLRERSVKEDEDVVEDEDLGGDE